MPPSSNPAYAGRRVRSLLRCTWLEEAWSSDQAAEYRWLKDESDASPVTLLSRPDGTATANVAEIDGLLQAAWRPINRKYAVDPDPDPAAIVRLYWHHVWWVPIIAPRLDGTAACARASPA